uniref:Uncharacterized protein n=1 Tax=Arundo donax TaxID=35708 RepID=A0A0A9CIY0_ARUDO
MCRLFSLLFPRPYRAAANRRLTISFTSYHHQIVSRPQAHGQIRSFEPSPSDPSQTEMVQLSLQSFHLGIYLAKSYCQMSRNVNLWMVQPQANYKLKKTKMDLVLQQKDWIYRMINQKMTGNCHLSNPFSIKIARMEP